MPAPRPSPAARLALCRGGVGEPEGQRVHAGRAGAQRRRRRRRRARPGRGRSPRRRSRARSRSGPAAGPRGSRSAAGRTAAPSGRRARSTPAPSTARRIASIVAAASPRAASTVGLVTVTPRRRSATSGWTATRPVPLTTIVPVGVESSGMGWTLLVGSMTGQVQDDSRRESVGWAPGGGASARHP